jgi:putative transposase
MKIQLKNQRKSFQTLHKVYCWTAAIHKGYPLLEDDAQKEKIIDVLDMLSAKKLVSIYGFVIMPNHIQVIWQQHGFYGKEMPLATFMKSTARDLKRKIVQNGLESQFKVKVANKKHQIWQRDAIAHELVSRRTMHKKLNQMHTNPDIEKGQLADTDSNYFFSSARYYKTGSDDFGFIKDLFTQSNIGMAHS